MTRELTKIIPKKFGQGGNEPYTYINLNLSEPNFNEYALSKSILGI